MEKKNIIQYFINQKDTGNKLQLTTWNLSRILINRINISILMKHIQELLTSSRGRTSFCFASHLEKDGIGNRCKASA